MQVGGDGKQACASCHFDAGADSRYKGQMNPGAASSWQLLGGGAGANYIASVNDYPFHNLADPHNRNSAVLSNTQNITASQGLYQENFIDIVPGSGVETASVVTQASSPNLFGVPDATNHGVKVSTRRTTGRNTPTAINAVFNYRNFWDGRAQNIFNGVSPIGTLDTGAFLLASHPKTGLLIATKKVPDHQIVRIANAALASQAVGPPMSDTEMAYAGRDFKKIGKKVLALPALAEQLVATDDSVLGPYSNQLATNGAKGLNATYAMLIQSAFRPKWWNSNQLVDKNGNFIMVGKVIKTGPPTNTNEFTLMEYNFSLFWGIAIQMYEATLVSDNSRFDQYMDGNNAALTSLELQGMNLFTGKGNCTKCHMGAEFTDASVGNLSKATSGRPGNPVAGFHNIGVRPLAELLATGSGAPGAVTTALKTPGLRNIAMTAPYFHNCGQLTLNHVAWFYSRGGDFGTRGVDVDGDINSFGFSPADEAAIASFLESLTDERVLLQSAPFDHPSLDLPNGAVGDNLSVTQNGATGIALDDPNTVLHVPATGKTGTTHPFIPYIQQLH